MAQPSILEVDELSLLYGEDIPINKYITIHQPTAREIWEFGEAKFFSVFFTLCSAARDMPAYFHDQLHVDFTTVSDWEFFIGIIRGYDYSDLQIMFNYDISKLKPSVLTYKEEQQYVLCDDDDNVIITKKDYEKFIKLISQMIGFKHKNKKPANRATANILIEDDRKTIKRNMRNPKPFESILYPTIVSLVNTEEFYYGYKESFDLTIYQLTLSLAQIQVKKNAVSLTQGSMSGFVDTSKIPSKAFSWIYDKSNFEPTGKKLINKSYK